MSYFFKDDTGHNVMVNRARYRLMLTDYFIPKMDDLELVDMIIQQDSTICHPTRDTKAILIDKFREQ